MSKVAIVYWSGTGNTASMAESVADGVKSKGGEAELFECSGFGADMLDNFDAVAFGCPAMGAETLEEDEFEPLFADCESKLSGKKLGLFGSYGWGDGEWMRTWEQECSDAGIKLAAESVICCEAPDDEALEACKSLGKKLAE